MSDPSALQNLMSNPEMARMAANLAGPGGPGADAGAAGRRQ
jgi:hypothetical protein